MPGAAPRRPAAPARRSTRGAGASTSSRGGRGRAGSSPSTRRPAPSSGASVVATGCACCPSATTGWCSPPPRASTITPCGRSDRTGAPAGPLRPHGGTRREGARRPGGSTTRASSPTARSRSWPVVFSRASTGARSAPCARPPSRSAVAWSTPDARGRVGGAAPRSRTGWIRASGRSFASALPRASRVDARLVGSRERTALRAPAGTSFVRLGVKDGLARRGRSAIVVTWRERGRDRSRALPVVVRD